EVGQRAIEVVCRADERLRIVGVAIRARAWFGTGCDVAERLQAPPCVCRERGPFGVRSTGLELFRLRLQDRLHRPRAFAVTTEQVRGVLRIGTQVVQLRY